MPTLQTHIQMFHGENPTNVHNAVKCFQISKTVLMVKKILNFIFDEYTLAEFIIHKDSCIRR